MRLAARGSSVIDLLLSRCPSTVTRFVIAVVIDAIKRQPWRGTAHIRKEVFKAIQPSLANHNATTAIVLIRRAIRIEAALSHTMPALVFTRSFLVSSARMRLTMGEVRLCSPLTLQTTTRLRMAVAQIAAKYRDYFPALATTFPHRFAAMVTAEISENQQSTKALSSNIFAPGHSSLPQGCGSSGGRAFLRPTAAHWRMA
jgi:hypothetical protein